jgi:hypothetical protein
MTDKEVQEVLICLMIMLVAGNVVMHERFGKDKY